MLLILVLFSTCTLSALAYVVERTQSIPNGTLIIIVPTNDGLLVCADRKVRDSVNGDYEITKIHQLGGKSLFALTGGTAINETIANEGKVVEVRKLFDVLSTVDNFFFNKDLKHIENYWRGLKELLELKLTEHQSEIYQAKPESTSPEGSLIFQLTFFYLNEQQKLKGRVVQAFYRRYQGHFNTSINMFPIADEHLRIPTPIATGDVDVYDEVKSGNDSRFDDIRSEKIIKRFLFENVPIEKATMRQAEAFARRMIKIASERASLINTPNTISPYCDCATLAFKGDFRWLRANEKTDRQEPARRRDGERR